MNRADLLTLPLTKPKMKLSDDEIWQSLAGSPFILLMAAAEYPYDRQKEEWLHFMKYVIPYLGSRTSTSPAMTAWQSFMTDNHCPIEMSWDWGWHGCSKIVRYSIEPIGRQAGNARDPINLKAPRRIMERLTDDFGFDTHIFSHLWSALICEDVKMIDMVYQQEGSRSQFFQACDLKDHGGVFKVYFLPGAKALEAGVSKWELIRASLLTIPGQSSNLEPAIETLDTFLSTSIASAFLEPEIVSVDCLPESQTRYKVYFRCRSTSFASVEHIVTLGGQMSKSELSGGLLELRRLWSVLFRNDPHDKSGDVQLQDKNHRTAGILYYFEFRPGRKTIVPKVYLPVRHYSPSDQHVTQTVCDFISDQARAAGVDVSTTLKAYQLTLSQLTKRSAEAYTTGLYTYIGCVLGERSVKLTSYFNPGVFEDF